MPASAAVSRSPSSPCALLPWYQPAPTTSSAATPTISSARGRSTGSRSRKTASGATSVIAVVGQETPPTAGSGRTSTRTAPATLPSSSTGAASASPPPSRGWTSISSFQARPSCRFWSTLARSVWPRS